MTGTTCVGPCHVWRRILASGLVLCALFARVPSSLAENQDNAEIGGQATSPPSPSESLSKPTPQPEVGARSATWNPPSPEAAQRINQETNAAPRVRIGLRLTPFKKVVTRARDGGSETRFIPAEPLRHTLRARLNKTNHFFVGEWHIETIPTKWVRKSRRYEVRLNIYRRFGAFGQLEETLGSVDLAGVLDEQGDRLFVLIGTTRKRLRDKFQNPSLDVVAGFTKPEKPREMAKGPGNVNIPEPPVGSNADAILRGRM